MGRLLFLVFQIHCHMWPILSQWDTSVQYLTEQKIPVEVIFFSDFLTTIINRRVYTLIIYQEFNFDLVYRKVSVWQYGSHNISWAWDYIFEIWFSVYLYSISQRTNKRTVNLKLLWSIIWSQWIQFYFVTDTYYTTFNITKWYL